MITFTTAYTEEDLIGILHLQRANLSINLSVNEIASQGFVTVTHTYEQLSKLNDREKHITAKNNDSVIGYLLAMTQQSRYDFPILIPMFEVFDKTLYKNKTIKDYNYIVVGQVCIDKSFRGQGILDKCYDTYKSFYGSKYDFAITEIAKTNNRSLNAHKRIGFKEIKTYTSNNIDWIIVVWDWQNCS